MARGIDHIVHAVRDLDAAAAVYGGLGFTVGARNRHPWGTHNRIVQFPGMFVELLTLAEPDKLGSDGISKLFGAYNGDFIARYEGLSLLILQSDNAQADESAFRAAHIGAGETVRFEREGRRPDGSPVKLGFSLAFAQDRMSPDIHFAVCEQHYPQNFWNPEFQRHANTATGIAGVVVVAQEPARHLDFMQSFAGAPAAAAGGGWLIETGRGAIEIIAPDVFTARFGAKPPDVTRGARLAAIRFALADAGLMQAVPQLAGMEAADGKGLTVIGPDDSMGAVLVFEGA